MLRKFFLVLSVITIASVPIGNADAGQILNTPTGLNIGDHFRFLFVTTAGTQELANSISDFDAFVNSDAAGATYGGQTVSWQAVVSDLYGNDAIKHIGVYGDAVYRPDGTMIANSDSKTGLWSGTLLNAPDGRLDGTEYGTLVWTGTKSDGTSANNFGLNYPTIGYNGATDGAWIDAGTDFLTDTWLVYGISQDLIAVPEPSTALLAGLGGVIGLAASFIRTRNKRQRSSASLSLSSLDAVTSDGTYRDEVVALPNAANRLALPALKLSFDKQHIRSFLIAPQELKHPFTKAGHLNPAIVRHKRVRNSYGLSQTIAWPISGGYYRTNERGHTDT